MPALIGAGRCGSNELLSDQAPAWEKGTVAAMNRKLFTVSAAAGALAFGVASASAAVTVIGSSGQSGSQAANSTQSGLNGDGGGGSTFILGSSRPTLAQTSTNTLSSEQAVGGGGGTTTLIGNGTNPCFCESSSQGVNSQQTGVNGSGGGGATTAILGDSAPVLTQSSTNRLGNGQYVGGAFLAGADTIIGNTAQANTQGVNSGQSGKNGDGGGALVFIGGPIGSTPSLAQTSCNDLSNETVLGSGSGVITPTCGGFLEIGIG